MTNEYQISSQAEVARKLGLAQETIGDVVRHRKIKTHRMSNARAKGLDQDAVKLIAGLFLIEVPIEPALAC